MRFIKNLFSKERLHWIYFAVIVTTALAVFAIYGTNIIKWRNSPDFGWRTMYDSGPNVVAEVFESGRAAGLRLRDKILAINGKPYNTFDELFFKIRNGEPGSVNTYTIVREGERVEIKITI